jgi:hypothetical protein
MQLYDFLRADIHFLFCPGCHKTLGVIENQLQKAGEISSFNSRVTTLDILSTTFDILSTTLDILSTALDILSTTLEILSTIFDILSTTLDILSATVDIYQRQINSQSVHSGGYYTKGEW